MIETLGDFLRNNAAKFPDEVAYRFEGDTVTFAQHHDRANRLAHALWQRGLRKQDRLSILSRNNLEFMECYAACELSGFIAATVNWRLTAPEMAWIIGDSTPRVLVFEAQYAPLVDKIRAQLPSVELFLCIGGTTPDWAEPYAAFRDAGSPDGAPARPRSSTISCPRSRNRSATATPCSSRPPGLPRRSMTSARAPSRTTESTAVATSAAVCALKAFTST